jgi:PEP-CTERM motif
LTHAIDEDLTGTKMVSLVFTGTNAGGTASSPLGGGKTTSVGVGFSDTTGSAWVLEDTKDATAGFDFYGISEVLTVPASTTAVPEPSTAVVAVFGATALIGYGWSRHRQAQRRQAVAQASQPNERPYDGFPGTLG